MAACLESLAVLQQTGVLPNVMSYIAAISACEKCKQGQEALGLQAVMQRTAVFQMSFPTMPPSVLVGSASYGSRPLVFGGVAVDCCSAHCHCLRCSNQCL